MIKLEEDKRPHNSITFRNIFEVKRTKNENKKYERQLTV